MESILKGNPELQHEIDKIAEVAGYLWQNGWAERNGGNITVNITQWVNDRLRQLPAISCAVVISFARELVNACAIWRASLWKTAVLSVF